MNATSAKNVLLENPPLRNKSSLPRGVLALSFVEMWERYSFYGLQAILTLYLIYSLEQGGLNLSPIETGGIVGAYGGAVYLSQLLGAWISERLVAPKWLVLCGAIAITAGHITLAIMPGLGGLGIALGLIILGTGALKTNITAMVGMLYNGHPRSHRDAGFSYFFMGISVGSILGPLTTGFAQTTWGFHYGFGVAAIVIGLSLVQYLLLMKNLPAESAVVNRPLTARGKAFTLVAGILCLAAIYLVFLYDMVALGSLTIFSAILTVGAAIVYFAVMIRSSKVSTQERNRVRGYIPFFIGTTVFFSLELQMYTTAPLFVDEYVDLFVGGWQVPTAWVVMIGTVASVASAPYLAWLWTRLGSRQPSPVTKLSIGIAVVCLGYFGLTAVSLIFDAVPVPLFVALMCMIAIAAAEMLIGPTGLSLATAIAPHAFKSQLVGVNFLNLAIGSTLAGMLAQIYSLTTPTSFFMMNAIAGSVVVVALVATRNRISRLLNDGIEHR